jgi:hypothetical protein
MTIHPRYTPGAPIIRQRIGPAKPPSPRKDKLDQSTRGILKGDLKVTMRALTRKERKAK